MALVVFLRGINVGGHRRVRPSVVARELSAYDVVSVGATGTFVVGRPGSRAKFRAELRRRLPFEAEVVLCDGRDILRLETDNPFGALRARADVVQFVSVLARRARLRAALPVTLPPRGEWFVRIVATKKRFVFGVYRRRMKTIGYLGRIDDVFGAPAITRSWSTMRAVARILINRAGSPSPRRSARRG
jgi:uncharacterized protein (DUF1697 family)